MKRTTLFVALALAIVFAAALVNVERASSRSISGSITGHDHGQDQHANHQSTKQRQEKQPIIDGAYNPNAISNSAAREIVMRLLTSNELNEGHKRAYLKEAGFNEAVSAALMFAAHDFKRQTERIEKDASDIKDKTWPNPDNATLNQLADLQREKEAILISVAADLDGRLRSFNALSNWETHITNRVKRKTKVFQVGLPTKKIGFFQLFPDPFAAFAQAPGCDTSVSVYSDTYVDWDQMFVVGVTSYSVPSNNCGHTFTPMTAISGPEGTADNGGEGAMINMDMMGEYFLDGDFQTNSDLDAFCPVIFAAFFAGANASNTVVEAFVSLGPFVNWIPSSTNASIFQGGVTAVMQVRGSTFSNGKNFVLDLNADTESGVFDLDYTGGGGHTFSGLPGATRTKTYNSRYIPKSTSGPGPHRFKPVANLVSQDSELKVRRSPREGPIFTIQP